MNLSDELALSYYKPVASIKNHNSVQLVQHVETGKFFVRKHLSIYHMDVYQSLLVSPIHNIPKIELLAEDGTGLTVIEEFIQGDTLQDILEQYGSLPEKTVVSYVLQLCRIVSDLHHHNPSIIHRDIKPSNIIVSSDGVIKLLDMNAAKYVTQSQSRDTMLLGTAGFAAPEQYGFAPSGVQSDLYAIGVLINVLVTGKMPTEKTADGKLAPIIQKCIELDPVNRYANVDDLIHELSRTQAASQSQSHHTSLHNRRQYLPPGFRSSSVPHMIIAISGYILIAFVGLCVDMENATRSVLILNRVVVILIELAVVFFTANYCDIQSYLPLTRSKYLIIRIIGILLYDIIIALALITVLVLIEPLA